MAGSPAQISEWLRRAMWAASAVLVFCAVIPAGHATSNLQSWANLAGLAGPGRFLAGRGSDFIVLFLAFLLVAKHLAGLKKPLEDAFGVVRSLCGMNRTARTPLLTLPII